MMTTECVATEFQTANYIPAARTRVLLLLCHLKHQRAQGMPGARCARSLACKIKKHTSIVTTVTPDTPGIPRAMVLTVSFVLLCPKNLAECANGRLSTNGQSLDLSRFVLK